jgi:hypothetical protein
VIAWISPLLLNVFFPPPPPPAAAVFFVAMVLSSALFAVQHLAARRARANHTRRSLQKKTKSAAETELFVACRRAELHRRTETDRRRRGGHLCKAP